jgi:NAD(P)-dependent dehydrogenase (short-subunit alcohol dehydrogenase family)
MERPKKVAVVTGVLHGGLPFHIARAFSRAGYRVAGVHRASTYRRPEEVKPLEKKFLRAMGKGSALIRANTWDLAEVRKAVAEISRTFGRVDVLVFGEGSAFDVHDATDFELEAFERAMQREMLGPLYLLMALLPWLRDSRGAVVSLTADLPLLEEDIRRTSGGQHPHIEGSPALFIGKRCREVIADELSLSESKYGVSMANLRIGSVEAPYWPKDIRAKRAVAKKHGLSWLDGPELGKMVVRLAEEPRSHWSQVTARVPGCYFAAFFDYD